MAEGPTVFDQVALRLYGSVATRRLSNHPQLPTKLSQAGLELVPSAYLASVYLRMTCAASIGVLIFIIYMVATGGDADPRMIVATMSTSFLGSLGMYSYAMLYPDLKINARKRSIDNQLPYALNFLAALAAAGVVPDQVFGALGKQDVYGEMAREASLIHRDTQLFSYDLIQALQEGARRSPSQQLAEFLQGAVTTITSGGDLKIYFLAKAEQYASENHRKQKAFIESMGVMAESYVVVAAAAPLFLIVILSVMMLLSSGGDPVLYLNLIILIGLPVIHGMFTWLLSNMRPE
ncbi:MAG: type II secretion system F family protein [Thermoplasmatota archaeon]